MTNECRLFKCACAAHDKFFRPAESVCLMGALTPSSNVTLVGVLSPISVADSSGDIASGTVRLFSITVSTWENVHGVDEVYLLHVYLFYTYQRQA